MKRFAILTILAAAATTALADKLTLKDGRTYEGEIVGEDDKGVKIKTAKATLSFPHEQIEKVEKGTSPLQERDRKLEALDPEVGGPYLELAEWMLGPGRDAKDDKILMKLLNIASMADESLAGRAQVHVGKLWLAKNNRAKAAEAFTRALAAEPENAEAKKELDGLKTELTARFKKEMAELKPGLELARDLKFGEALPILRKCRTHYSTDWSMRLVNMSFEELCDDLQKRVTCAACNNSAKRPCTVCDGRGVTVCGICDGKGVKKNPPAGKLDFYKEMCTHCYHTGELLCTGCDAERTITVCFNADVKGGNNKVDVKLKAGVEKVELSKLVNLAGWTRKRDNARATMVITQPVSKGGFMVCKVCKGIPYDPPQTEVPTYGLQDWINEIDERLSGKVEISPVAPTEMKYDPDEVADGKFRWKDGKWTE
jgi:tetratricopeptide (TPR) repeat protein